MGLSTRTMVCKRYDTVKIFFIREHSVAKVLLSATHRKWATHLCCKPRNNRVTHPATTGSNYRSAATAATYPPARVDYLCFTQPLLLAFSVLTWIALSDRKLSLAPIKKRSFSVPWGGCVGSTVTICSGVHPMGPSGVTRPETSVTGSSVGCLISFIGPNN